MTDQGKKPSDASVITRLAGRGEDALTRLMDDLGRNPRVTDALSRTMAAKGKVDETTRRTLGQVGLAAAGEIRDLREGLERLEKRLEDLERRSTSEPTRAGRKPAASTMSSGGTPRKSPVPPPSGPSSTEGSPSTPPESPSAGPSGASP
ncbi:MAG: hypothetical protein M3327_05875 [Actinomycetota bacterium]|nr:hypothetical protein [Actinomycetota bacterium]